MSKSLNIICLFFLVFPWICIAQVSHNPRQYFNFTNKAELAIVDSNYQAAVGYYQQAFQYLQEPFGKDLSNFLHCGLITNDKKAVEFCVPKFKERNYQLPFWRKYYQEKPIGQYLDSVYQNSPVQSKIDTNYRNFIKALMVVDQKVRKENERLEWETYRKLCTRIDSINMLKLKQYIDSSHIFPTEQVVGNQNNTAWSSLPYEILFIHYAASVGIDSAFVQPVNLGLDKKVLNGVFPPDLYAHLCDTRKYGMDGKKFDKNKSYGEDYIILFKYKEKSSESDSVETWRTAMVLQKIELEELKTLNKRRHAMNMEPYEDLLKKVRYQASLDKADFTLVNVWLTSVIYEPDLVFDKETMIRIK